MKAIKSEKHSVWKWKVSDSISMKSIFLIKNSIVRRKFSRCSDRSSRLVNNRMIKKASQKNHPCPSSIFNIHKYSWLFPAHETSLKIKQNAFWEKSRWNFPVWKSTYIADKSEHSIEIRYLSPQRGIDANKKKKPAASSVQAICSARSPKELLVAKLQHGARRDYCFYWE